MCRCCAGSICINRCPDAHHHNVYINEYLNALDDVVLNGWIHLIFTVSITAPIFKQTVPLVFVWLFIFVRAVVF